MSPEIKQNSEVGDNNLKEREQKKGLVAVAFGQEGLKAVEGEMQRAIPFVGADHQGRFSTFGVGVILPENNNTAHIWGLISPHMVLRSWRAMKILEHVEVIESGTLCQAWYAGAREPHSSDQHYIDELTAKNGGDKFKAIREKILNEVPTPDELDRTLAGLIKNDIDVSSWELQNEVEEGRLASSSLIDELVAKDELERQKREVREEESKKPVSIEQSVAVFFRQLGIKNMIVGDGEVGISQVGLDELERLVRIDSYYSEEIERPLLHQDKKSNRVNILDDMPTYQSEGNGITNPLIKADNGTTYTLTSVKFEGGNFIIRTVVQPKYGESQEVKYTVPQLRETLQLKNPNFTEKMREIVRRMRHK